MPKKGIHPVVRSITYVLKNGASVELPTVLNRQMPYTLQADTTTNALWTGEKETQTGPSGQSAKMMRRYERMGFKFNRGDDETATKDAGQNPGATRNV